MTKSSLAYALPRETLVLKRLIVECDINQSQLAKAAAISHATINLCVNRGYIPHTRPDFCADVEAYLQSPELAVRVQNWLLANGLRIADIWQAGDGRALHRAHSPRIGRHVAEGRLKSRVAMQPVNPEHIKCKEVEMLTQATRDHFKPLFKDPFPTSGGIEKAADIYMSEEHMYIEAAILDAAKNGGFMAVIGDSGAGKTVIKKKCIEQLKRDGNINVILPDFVNCERINSSSMLDAIILDISSVTPKMKLEHKTRQVQQLLLERANEGTQSVLIIEEAHVQTIRHLKRFYEMEHGWKKLLGIILLGQTELATLLDENRHPELREVIRRMQVAKLNGLDGNLASYLELKFKRVGKKLTDVVDEEAINLLGRRLSMDTRPLVCRP